MGRISGLSFAKVVIRTLPPRFVGYTNVTTYGQLLETRFEQLQAITLGNMVAMTRIDCLARSTFDLFTIAKQIIDAGAQFRSLAEPWAAVPGRLMSAVLGELVGVERNTIRTRAAAHGTTLCPHPGTS